jgi:hypothetical protein
VDVVELPSEIGFAFDGFLYHFFVFVDIFAHECCGIAVKGFFEVGGFDVFHEMEETDDDEVQFVDGFPAAAEKVETDVAVFIDVGMQYLVEAFNFWRFEGVLFGYGVAEGDLAVAVDGAFGVGEDGDMQFGHWALIGEADDDVIDLVLVVFLDVDFHAFLGCYYIAGVLLWLCFFLL